MSAGNDLDVVYRTGFGDVRISSLAGQPALADWTVQDASTGRVLGYIADTRDNAVLTGVPSTFNPVSDDDESPPRPFECYGSRGLCLGLSCQSVRGAATAIAGAAHESRRLP